MSLKGRTAVITGSNSGIGLGVAGELAKAGADVVLNSFTDADEDHALAERIAAEHGISARYIAADMADPDQCRALIEQAGVVDILVNNAGIQHVAPVEEFPREKWDAIIAIMLSSAFHTTAAALPGMRERGWGRIVNIASAHGLTASPYKAAYVAAKHGLVGLTKTVALETAEDAITANAICPGYVLTPLVEKQIPATMEKVRDGPGAGDPRGHARAPAVEAVRHRRAARRHGGVPLLIRGRPDYRHDHFGRRRLDGVVGRRKSLFGRGFTRMDAD